MKLLFYIGTMGAGGAERVIANLANEMYERGYKCVLVNTYQKKDEYKINEGIKRYYLDDRKRGNFVVRNILYSLRLHKICKKEGADINLSFVGEPNIRLIIATRGLHQKTIVSVRNVPEKEYGNKKFLKMADYLFQRADGIVFQTAEAQNSFSNKVQVKGKIILNPVNKLFYDFRKNIGFDQRKGIVSVGRLSPQKNYPLLLEAYAKVSSTIKEDLTIYGTGQEEQKLRELAKKLGINNHVSFAGISNQLWKDINTAKLFIMTSEHEGMPNALMEAMALGIPVIASDCPCGGPRAILGDSINGILIKSKESADFAEAIEKLLTDERLWKFYHQKAIEKSEMFLSKKIFDEWEEYFQSF